MRKGRKKQVDINGGVGKVRKYYPYFCHVVGHSTAASKECYMNRKTKLEKDEATQKIEETLIRKYMKKIVPVSKYSTCMYEKINTLLCTNKNVILNQM